MSAAAPEASVSSADLHRLFDEGPMSGAQVTAVAVTAVLSALDGYDVLSVTFAAPALVHAWHVGKAALGVVLASGLLGMAAGSLGLAPLADVVGRRRVVLGALLVMVAGGVLSALSRNVIQMAGSRVFTGLGIGVLVAVITPLASEFANARRRAFAVTVMAVGYPVGGVLGGLAAAWLLKASGWAAIFWAKSFVALLVLPAVLWLMPESPAFILARARPDALEKINAYLRRCRRGTVAALPPPAAGSGGYRALFAGDMARATLRLTLANGLFVMTAYYVLSWLPQMVVDAGYKPSTASLVSSLANLAGVGGGLLLGAAARRLGLQGLVAGALIGLGVATAAFGLAPNALPLLMLAAGVCGFFLISGISGLYATIAATFTSRSRASGSGFVIGVGRATSATAPYLAGWMFASGLTRAQVSLAFAALSIAAGLVIAFGRPGADRRRS